MDNRTSKNQKRISRNQEKRIARDVGGRTQPASGALPGAKGDVRVMGQLRVEAKYTAKDSYSLKLADLEKIVGEAGLEKAVLQLCFIGRSNTPIASFAIYPDKAPTDGIAEAMTFGKSITISRDSTSLCVAREGRMFLLFTGEDITKWFAIQNWADYLADREPKDA